MLEKITITDDELEVLTPLADCVDEALVLELMLLLIDGVLVLETIVVGLLVMPVLSIIDVELMTRELDELTTELALDVAEVDTQKEVVGAAE